MFESLYNETDVLNSDEAQVLGSLVYDIAYGIHDHNNPMSTNPLASVMQHPAEDYSSHSGLYRTIERYERQKISENFGLSLIEYLDLPRYVVDMLTNIFIDNARESERVANTMKKQAEEALQGIKK